MNKVLLKGITIMVAAVLMAACVGGAFALYDVSAGTKTVGISASIPQYTIYFTNNANWGAVNAYVWIYVDGSAMTKWPGTAMTYVENNEYGQAVYSITFAKTYDRIIFNNGSGAQTVDIELSDTYNAYYTNGTSGGNYVVVAYTR